MRISTQKDVCELSEDDYRLFMAWKWKYQEIQDGGYIYGAFLGHLTQKRQSDFVNTRLCPKPNIFSPNQQPVYTSLPHGNRDYFLYLMLHHQ